jgi:hypothetical protein
MPSQMANRAEAIGIKKAHLDFWTMFNLSRMLGSLAFCHPRTHND